MSNTTQLPEGHPLEASFPHKIESGLEHDFKKLSIEHSYYSSGSTSSEMMNSERGCRHPKLLTQDHFENCVHCGAYVSKNGVQTFKSKTMNYSAFFPPRTIYESITKRSFPLRKNMNPEYVQLRQTYVEWILDLSDKLRISPNTRHLAVALLDFMMFHDPSLTSKLQLFAPVCLLVAAKTIELDERIPFIARLRRHTNGLFTAMEYTKAELQVLDAIDWNAQLSTFYEINDFLMCQGVLFSNDEIEDNNEATNELKRGGSEGLREINQYENTNYLGNKERLSHESASSNSDVQKGANTAEESAPAHLLIPRFSKTNSTPAHLERRLAVSKSEAAIKRKAKDILANFESSYPKLNTLVLKDADFVEWEPKIISAATVAFFRSVNRVTPLWNSELEAITQLKFWQISPCYDLLSKKFDIAFNFQIPKYQRTLSTPETDKNITLAKAASDRPTIGYDKKVIEPIPVEQKSTISYQSKSSLPAVAALSMNNGTGSFIRDDLRYQSNNGMIQPELPQSQKYMSNNPTTFSENYYYSEKSYENSYSYSSRSSYTGSTNGTSYIGENYGKQNDSYLKNDPCLYKTTSAPMLSDRTNSSYESGLSYQSRLDALKK